MATWIFILHMLAPLSGLEAIESATWAAAPPDVARAAEAEDADGLRYRGLERMFAKFETEGE
ncbi:MAG: hypothetical protein JNL82_10715 [Myxococcales bacterium]|nr:hypothetical protein [Myxococcales bacterium]